jgi:hypothetical protein
MRRILSLFAILLLTGCNFDLGQLFDLIEGRETNLVVLSKRPLELSPQITTLVSADPMKVVGQSTFVCFALRGEIALTHVEEMEKVFQESMHGAKVKVNVLLKNGDRMSLREPLQAWRMYGRILEKGEFSACATITQCKEQWPVGALVDKIEVSSEPSLSIMGVYWESQRAPLEKLPSSSSSATTSVAVQKKACNS